MSNLVAKLTGVVAAGVLALGLVGCSAQPPVETSTPTAPASEGQNGSSGDEGNDGRAFDSTDDAIITALLAAIPGAESAEWQGKSIRIFFSEGSVNDVTAGIGCLAAQTLIAEDETSFMVYPDGEIDCSTRH